MNRLQAYGQSFPCRRGARAVRCTGALARTTRAASLVAAVAATCIGALAADYPHKPLQVIVPFAAGGGLDTNARAFSQALGEILKVSVVVVNKDGAAGTIGLQAAASAQPDGHTLAFTPAVSLTSQPHRVKTSYQIESFTPVCQVFDNIFAIAVVADSPLRTVRDLLDRAAANPGTISYGTSGVGSIPHMGTADIEAATKVTLTHVPYKGDAPIVQDLLAGRIQFGAMLASSISGQVQSGAMRLLAVYSDRRHPAFPNVPTLTESGVAVVQASFGGVLVPAKTPAEVVATLQDACEKAAKSPGYLAYAAQAGQVVDYQPAPTFLRRLQEDSKAKAATIKRLGL